MENTACLIEKLAARNPKSLEDVHNFVARIGTYTHFFRVNAAKSRTGKAYLVNHYVFRDSSEILVHVTAKGEAFKFVEYKAVE